ncbi:DUF389 domain-containing protein [Nocardia alni]|uniref:DUF389 domain-containing protein n=1 Tax=Nocardia alni TaxID=2815723 RepID=UPI001C22D768|nr:DUF389 domain-containing protein [Nocardia alni]
MLHVRAVCPAETTEAALAALHAEPGATLITVQRGAAVEPAGDVIEAEVARESVNDLVDALEALGIAKDGGILLGPIDTAISQSVRHAVAAAPGESSDAVVWESLLAQTRDESTLSPSFLAFITIACLLAAVGVATDSPVTIVGAMVVGPEFGPLAALAVSLVRKNFALARRSALALLVGFPVAMAITVVATLAWRHFGWLTVDNLDHIRNVRFIYEVGPFSLVVALLAGAAGMLSLMTSKSAALVGVFISVTTVPAAGFAVVAATLGEWDKVLWSILQLVVNMVGIVAAGAVVLKLRPRRRAEGGPMNRIERWWVTED